MRRCVRRARNQLGILGFGGDRKTAAASMPSSAPPCSSRDDLVAGAEYRQKPDNLSSFEEDDYWDLFVGMVPDKHVSVTAAYADLGNIAMKPTSAAGTCPCREVSSARLLSIPLNPFGKGFYSRVRV